MAADEKKKAEPKEKAPPKEKTGAEAPAKDKATTEATPAADAKTEAKPDTPKRYSRGEGQKAVTQAYKDNWNAIYGKKKKKR